MVCNCIVYYRHRFGFLDPNLSFRRKRRLVHREKAKKIFFETVEKVNNPDPIKYIKIDDNTEEIFVYDAPVELFDDLHVKSYEQIEDIEKPAEIWSQNCVTVFFNDGTATSFFITHSGEIYWGTSLKVECPSLLVWFETGKG